MRELIVSTFVLCLTSYASAQFPNPLPIPSSNGVETVTIRAPQAATEFGSELAAIGDINGDGRPDFAVGVPTWSPTNTIDYYGACYVFFGGSAWAAQSAFDAATLDGTRGFVVRGEKNGDQLGASVDGAGDVNGDGYDDLLISAPNLDDSAGNNRGGAYVLFGGPNVGAGGVIAAASIQGSVGFRVLVPQPGSSGARFVAGLGDVDGDGYADIGISAERESHPEPSVPLGAIDTPFLASGDIDGDGDIDIVATQRALGRFVVLYNNGGMQFSVVPYPLSYWPEDIRLADMDNDGDLDLVVKTRVSGANVSEITVVKNQSNGFFGPATHYSMGTEYIAFDLADVDGDGAIDVVVSTYDGHVVVGGTSSIYVMKNNGNGGLALASTLISDDEPRNICIGDIDGDGDVDVAVYCFYVNRLLVFENLGGGIFNTTPVITPGVGSPEPMCLCDVDGDGDLDLASTDTGSVWVSRNQGNFSFAPLTKIANVQNTSRLLARDIDGDGDIDILASGRTNEASQFTLCLNDGLGGFQQRSFSQGALWNQDIAVDDFDSDGQLDVALAARMSTNSYAVALTRNKGAGTFAGIESGAAYVLRGSPSLSSSSVYELGQLGPAQVFVLRGRTGNERLGCSISALGDIDADGLADFAVGASAVWPGGAAPGAQFVVRGAVGLGASGAVDVHALSGPDGFAVHDLAGSFYFLTGKTQPCDIDGDGWRDLVFGAGNGTAYIAFGSPTLGSNGHVPLSSPDGVSVLEIVDAQAGDGTGDATVGCGDINGDGFDDVLLGAKAYDETLNNRGAVFVAYGAQRPFPSGVLSLGALDGSNGFRMLGAAANDRLGGPVRCVGDVDGDGITDVLVGAWLAQNDGRAYLVLGQRYGAPTVYCAPKVNSLGCTPLIGWTGQLPSVSDIDAFFVSATALYNQKNGQLFYGINGRGNAPFQGGTLCVHQPVHRTLLQSSGGNVGVNDCSGSFSFDWRAWMHSGVDPSLTAGVTVNAQYWSRDPQASFTTNLTAGIEFTIGP